MNAQLATLVRDADGFSLPLAHPTTVGRSSRCTLVLDDPSVSGHHAQLTWHDDAWWLRDLGSRNGTRIDGRLLPPGQDVPLDAAMVVEFGLDDGVWRLHGHGAPDGALATARTATAHREPTLSEVAFRFRVSPDEEFASWSVDTGDRVADLGGRSFVYLLVTLARERLADRERGLGLADRGWMVGDELARRLGMTPETMKVHVYRAREQLREVGVLGAGGVVERRSTTNQIRFGSDQARVDVAD